MSVKISAVVITLNEEANLPGCLSSLQKVADEIVVLDSFSTDNTIAVATQMGARVFQEKFNGYTAQKNKAVALAAYDMVLSLDADEVLSEELQQRILQEKQQASLADAYTMNRLNFYCGKAIKTCGWYPDKKIRFWNRKKGGWQGGLVHEQMQMNPRANIAFLQGDILHYTYPTHEAMLQQVEAFATLAAKQLQHKSLLALFIKLLFSPVVKFIRCYILLAGFTEGLTGWHICYQQSREVFLKYKHAIQLKLTAAEG